MKLYLYHKATVGGVGNAVGVVASSRKEADRIAGLVADGFDPQDCSVDEREIAHGLAFEADDCYLPELRFVVQKTQTPPVEGSDA